MSHIERIVGVVLVGLGCAAGGCGLEDPRDIETDCSLVIDGDVEASFGDPELDALIEASGRFVGAAADLDRDVREACNAIAVDLGGATSDDTTMACDGAVAQIEATVAASGGAVLTLVVLPPVCSVSGAAVVECTAECDASFDADATAPTCEGGELSGSCSGDCSGSCTVEGTVACDAACQGSCSGDCAGTVTATCTGTCTGQCDGTCASEADGSCAGSCDGVCHGTCEGTIEGSCTGSCSGTCEGSCRSDVTASCEGTCTGDCDVAFEEPRCEGGHLEVMADVDCAAACESRGAFEMECGEPTVTVSFVGPAADPDAMVDLLATLEANYGVFVAAAARGAIIVDATTGLADSLEGAVEAATEQGLQAGLCLADAIQAVVDASASMMISVEASVEVTGSVQAGT